jgi:hypothetical protein
VSGIEIPDEPRWVEARALQLAGAPATPAGRGWLIRSDADDLAVAVGDVDAAAVARLVSRGTLLCAIERADVAAALAARGWHVEKAVLHALVDPDGLPDDDGATPLDPQAALDHLPAALAAELRRALDAGHPVHACWVDGAPVSFAYAPWRTERWFDVSVDTAPGARQLGLATRAAAAMIRAERAAGREPVWGAAESNRASLRLAARLGFVPVDALWVISAP